MIRGPKPLVSTRTSGEGRLRSALASLPEPRGPLRLLTQGVKVALIGVVALLIVLGGVKFFAYARHSAAEAEGLGQPVTLTILKKDDETQVAQKLRAAGLIHSEFYFKSLMKVKKGVLAPGTYVLTKGLSVSAIIAVITR